MRISRALVLALAVVLSACYGGGADAPQEPIQQQAQEGSWCIGCITVSSTYLVDGSSASFRSSGLTLVVPGTRCLDQAARDYFPPGATCSDIWAGFPVAPQPQRYPSTVGAYAARWVIQPSTVPVGAAPALLWVYENGYDANGVETGFRWRYVQVMRRSQGVLFRLVDHHTRASIPSIQPDYRCSQLFTYFPPSTVWAHEALERAGYRLDIVSIAAFEPFRDGNLEVRIGREQPISPSLFPDPRSRSAFSPQLTVFRDGACWFAVNYGDRSGTAVFPPSLANRNEYLTQYFGATGGP